METILSDAALACPAWSQFFWSGAFWGALTAAWAALGIAMWRVGR
jgi:hypothetical protein